MEGNVRVLEFRFFRSFFRGWDGLVSFFIFIFYRGLDFRSIVVFRFGYGGWLRVVLWG